MDRSLSDDIQRRERSYFGHNKINHSIKRRYLMAKSMAKDAGQDPITIGTWYARTDKIDPLGCKD